MREFVIGENDAGQRLDRFIKKAVPRLGSGLYKYIRQKDIKLNGKRAEISQILAVGDHVKMYIPDSYFEEEKKPPEPEYKGLGEVKAVYEDENIIAAYKPAGLVVHEDDGGETDTLIFRIKGYLAEKGEYDPGSEQSFAPALCNRIDRGTEGLVLCAKNAAALREMNRIIRAREIEKTYLCLTVGVPREREGTIRTYLEKDERENTVYVRAEKTPNSRTAVTKYRVVKASGELALVEVSLLTGRTHQIRVHMAYIGCPLLGDGKYDRNAVNRRYGVKSQCLCAYRIGFHIKDKGSPLGYLNGVRIEAPRPGWGRWGE